MGFFPLYRDNLLTGPSYVSLSIPPIPSGILKSLNMEGNSSFLLPNTDYIKKDDPAPDLAIVIPLNTEEINTHTVVFNEECLDNFNNLLDPIKIQSNQINDLFEWFILYLIIDNLIPNSQYP